MDKEIRKTYSTLENIKKEYLSDKRNQKAVMMAINDLPQDSELRAFLLKNKEEVTRMILEEMYYEDLYKAEERKTAKSSEEKK